MKTELEFLTDLIAWSKTGGVTFSDVRQMIYDRIDDLNRGYTREEAEIQSRMDAVDAMGELKINVPCV